MKKNLPSLIFWPLSILAFLIAVVVTVWSAPCPEEIEVSLGSFSSIDSGNRASIQRLSSEIKKCPGAHSYQIIWYVNADKKTVACLATRYDRSQKVGDSSVVGYETDVGSGYAEIFAIANDSPVHEVAAKNGTFTDFKKYDIKPNAHKNAKTR